MTSSTDSARLERIVGIVLRIGVSASTASLAIGLALSFFNGLDAAAGVLLNTGIVILLITPVARVVVSVAEYALQQDWIFVGLTMTVLVELLASAVAAMYGRRL
jgi:uncharacterized membrane protein